MEAREYPAFTADNAPKAGEKVIKIKGFRREPVAVLTVTKVTPTGIIRTAEGESFKPWYSGEYTEITPYTEELAAQALEYQRRQEEEQARRKAISEARQACRVMADRGSTLPYEVAVELLEVYEAWKEVLT